MSTEGRRDGFVRVRGRGHSLRDVGVDLPRVAIVASTWFGSGKSSLTFGTYAEARRRYMQAVGCRGR
jgi:excinuclease UvrABC ATPase subunit